MQNPQVIIVGAGPTGLLAAITLAKAGIKIRIFEKMEKRSQYSRALAIHAGTLEYLEVVHPELLQKLLARGKKVQHLRFGEKYRLDISIIPSKYNFILDLEQEETEEILEEHLLTLGVKVERPCPLIDAKNFDDKVTATMQSAEGNITITADYLLDCSGAHSVIRKNILKIPFNGEKYFGRLVMGDVKIFSDFLRKDGGYVTGNGKGFAGFIPLDIEPYFRVILIPHTSAEIPQKISIDYFRDLAKSIAPHIELSEENKWLTSFEISKRLASKLRVGRIFLAGDAAHIHSPVGGQGMNLGMQDALNISLKLKRIFIDGENAKILDDYEKQRLPIIKDVLRSTNAAMRSGVEKSLTATIGIFVIKKIIAPIFFSSKFLQKKMCTKISQIKSARKEIGWIKSNN